MKQDDFSFLGNIDIDIVEALYRDYRKDPGSVEESWQQFFKGFDFAREEFKDQFASETLDKEFNVINLIDAYRKRGHLFTKTNPVRTRRKYFPTLDIENYGLADEDLDTVFHAGKELGMSPASLREIVDHLLSDLDLGAPVAVVLGGVGIDCIDVVEGDGHWRLS